MKTDLSKSKSLKTSQPFDVIKAGSISIPIYVHTNIIPQRDPQTGAILYETLPDGKRKALIKYQGTYIQSYPKSQVGQPLSNRLKYSLGS